MPILYSVITRGPTVLAKYAECVGNFAEVTEQIIPKIKLEDHKLTYSHGNYLIHYICEDRIIYMCITDDVSSDLNIGSIYGPLLSMEETFHDLSHTRALSDVCVSL